MADNDDVGEKLLLDHFYPQYADVDLVSEIGEKYSGEIVKAVDLAVVEV